MHAYRVGRHAKRTSSRSRDVSTVTYVQLDHNVWSKEEGHANKEVIYSLGRLDELKLNAIRRLVKSLLRAPFVNL